jgi:hypothetical protein
MHEVVAEVDPAVPARPAMTTSKVRDHHLEAANLSLQAFAHRGNPADDLVS